MADGTRLAKVALARVSNLETGVTSISDPRVSPLSQSLGVTYDGNNNVATNTTNTRLVALEAVDHTHTNKTVLDLTDASYTTTVEAHISDLETRLAALELALADYAIHTHTYQDNNGTIDIARTTTGVD